MNELFNKLPFVRLVIPFIIGITISLYLNLDVLFLWPLGVLGSLVLLGLVYNKSLSRNYSLRWLIGIYTNVFLILFGILIATVRIDIHKDNHFSKVWETDEMVLAKVLEPLSEKQRSFKSEVEILAVKRESKLERTTGKAMVYFRKDSNSAEIKYGDMLLIQPQFNEIQSPQNPSEFDYQRYLSFHNIHHQTFLGEDQWEKTGVNEGVAFLHAIYSVRKYLFSVLDQHIPNDRELAVASALLLGYREHLDQDIVKAYSSSGAMHVLAVSGLHVGIIYIIFNFMFSFLERFRNGLLIKSIVIVLLIWVYAGVTGLSPSVQRAAMMFSFIAIAKSRNTPVDIYNVIGVSAFVLLLIRPQIIMEVGFQLSYMAVIGIIFLHGRLYKLWYVKNWLGRQVWSLTCVSLAAQLATFPIGLLYFHQFPTFFLFSNWVVIPAAFAILYIGVLLFAVSWIAPLAKLVGTILYFVITALNYCIFLIEGLPHSLMQGFWIGILETWLIYLVIIALIAFIIRLDYKWAVTGAIAAILLSLNLAYETVVQNRQKQLIVYHVPNERAIDFIDGTSNHFLADSSLTNDWSKMLFHVKHNWWESGVFHQEYIVDSLNFKRNQFWREENYFQFYAYRVGLIDQSTPLIRTENKLKLDFLVIEEESESLNERCSNVF